MNEKGVLHFIPLFVLASLIGIITFILFSNLFVFKNPQFAQLFPKKQSEASDSAQPSYSIIKVHAFGTPAKNIYPTMILALDGKFITQWENVAGSEKEYTYTFPNKVRPNLISIGFANDLSDAATKQDRNLKIDKINLDGVDYQTEDPTTYSEGSFGAGVKTSCGKGFSQSEWLYCNGFFAFSPKLPSQNVSSPSPTCQPKPTCLDAEPRCLKNEPIEGWCSTIKKVTITTIDPDATVFATYQSHNQKVVSNSNGIFLTYLHNAIENLGVNTNTWRLMRSIDGGNSFTTIYEATALTRAPVIETDSANNLYVVAANWADINQAKFYKFSPSNNYASPVIQTTLNLGTTSAKFAMEIDEARSQLYYFTLDDTFTIIDFDGKIKNQFKLTRSGNSGFMHYPSLYLDENGHLFAAWTTTDLPANIYWSIHFTKSEDGGITWKKSNGQNLTLPIIADETGPTERITLNDEFTAHTWLSSFFVKNNKAYFTYYTRAPLNRQHFVRYSLTTSSIEQNVSPAFVGAEGNISIDTLDGGICVPHAKTTIYCIGRSQNPYGPAVLRSDDEGQTWHDYAVSEPAEIIPIYAIGGSPKVTSDGYIIGTYTYSSEAAPKTVRFFKVPI